MMAESPFLEFEIEPTSDKERICALEAEVDRLRSLLGPTEESYLKLRLDLLAARDSAIAAEYELGHLSARIMALESDIVRYRRDFVWFRRFVLRRFTAYTSRVRALRHAVLRSLRR